MAEAASANDDVVLVFSTRQWKISLSGCDHSPTDIVRATSKCPERLIGRIYVYDWLPIPVGHSYDTASSVIRCQENCRLTIFGNNLDLFDTQFSLDLLVPRLRWNLAIRAQGHDEHNNAR